MMVIFLTGLVSMILMRTLRNDYAKYAREDDDLESLVSIWVPVHMLSNCIVDSLRISFASVCPLPTQLLLKLWYYLGRREMLMRNQDGSLSMVMYFGLPEVWCFSLHLLVLAPSWQLLSYLWLCWPSLACCTLGTLDIQPLSFLLSCTTYSLKYLCS
jgi:hypothetical protein